MLSYLIGNQSVKKGDGAEGKGLWRKRMTLCNEVYRGSKFALIRKDADFHLSYSKVEKGEYL